MYMCDVSSEHYHCLNKIQTTQHNTYNTNPGNASNHIITDPSNIPRSISRRLLICSYETDRTITLTIKQSPSSTV